MPSYMSALFLFSLWTMLAVVHGRPSYVLARNETAPEAGHNPISPNFDTNILRAYNKVVLDHPDRLLVSVLARPRHREDLVDTPEELNYIRLNFVSEQTGTWVILSETTWGQWGEPEHIGKSYTVDSWFKPSSIRYTVADAIKIASREFVTEEKLSGIRIAPKELRSLKEDKDPIYTIQFAEGQVKVSASTGKIIEQTAAVAPQ